MLAPFTVTSRLVVYPCQKLEVVEWHLRSFDAQLVVQLALCSTTHSCNRCIEAHARLAGNPQRVRAAGVCPHVGEGYLLARALLQEEPVLGVEEEDGECAVE